MFFEPAVRTARFVPRAYDRSLERFVNDALSTARRSLNVEQDDKSWTLTLDVPGFSREDLTIGIEGAVVRIESKADAKRQFKGAYELPQDIDVGTSEAKLENGVLTLKLGKLVPVSNVARLPID
jgi:HSP20 family molecular chaperone IbpA